MKYFFLILFTFFGWNTFAQPLESITQKVSQKICDCMSEDMDTYAAIKPEFNRCYDQEFNFIFNLANAEEQKVLVQPDGIQRVKDRIIPTLNENCDKIKNIIRQDLNASLEKAFESNHKSLPLNFKAPDVKKWEKHQNQIVTLEGRVLEIQMGPKNTPLLQLEMGKNKLWVYAMMEASWIEVGDKIRAIGYLLEKEEVELSITEEDPLPFIVLSFGIADLNHKKLSHYPGSEVQIKEWIEGKIPEQHP